MCDQWPQNSGISRDGPKAPAKEITREGKVYYQYLKCRLTQFSAVIGRPGSDEPGRPITVLNRVGLHFGYSSSSHGDLDFRIIIILLNYSRKPSDQIIFSE